jgi:hypothetical protein
MTVVAEIRSAQAVPPWGAMRFLRRNEDRVIVAALVALIVGMTGLVLSLDLAPLQGTETGVCEQRTPSSFGPTSFGYVFLTMH